MWPFRSYKRNRFINDFMLDTLTELSLEDTWEHRLIILESIRLQWETRVPPILENEELIREFAKFMKALDEEIAYNLDRCIETSCPR